MFARRALGRTTYIQQQANIDMNQFPRVQLAQLLFAPYTYEWAKVGRQINTTFHYDGKWRAAPGFLSYLLFPSNQVSKSTNNDK